MIRGDAERSERRLGSLADRLLGAPPDMQAHATGGPARPVIDRPLDPSAFDQLLALARTERVTGILAEAAGSGVLAVTDDQFDTVALAHRRSMAIVLVLERLMVDTSRRLAANGVDHVVLKGSALAHLVYPSPSLRDFGDVDLLIGPGQMPLAVRLLTAAGAHRPQAEPAPNWDRDFAKSVTMVDGSGYEIDLHRTIAPGVFGLRIDPTGLFTATQTFRVAGTSLRGLSPDGQLLQACIHTAAGNRRVWLSSVCDIVALVRSQRVDLDRFHAAVAEWRMAAVVERAVAIVAERLGGADVSSLLDGLRVSRIDRRRLERYGGGFAGPARGGFSALPLTRWPAYARALVWPAPASLADRDLTRAQHLSRLRSHL